MGLVEVQRALARLYTDGALRERFFAAPEAEAGDLGLTSSEALQLAEQREEIASFARSLLHKRLGEAGQMIPAAREALGPDFAALFREYAVSSAGQGARKPSEDAIGFVRFLTGLTDDRFPLTWILDLARYEAAWLEARRPGFRLLIRTFRWPVHRLAHDVSTSPIAPRRFVGVWFRPGPRGRLRFVRL